MVARGDRYEDIAPKFNITPGTITDIKQRNPDTLAILKENLMTHRVSQATKILDKANKAIEQKLDESESFDDKVQAINQEWAEGVITDEERNAKLRVLSKLTISDLTSISREMHNQSKTEGEDKPPPLTPQESQQYLVDLAKGLESGDAVVLERLVFRKQ